ncbi:lysozyme inhibitor LprI family protein [Escherichia coli]|uniref:lysozyme inhibitor LprI family protein n=1 Tax=Escherichia coli TaxID=562 RepID=UPI0013319F9B|nr:lysozyme inhibitor LprI family protein [Escherichia coli]
MKNIIAAIVLSATAFGADAASFDCTKATTKSEKFICANESISALDSKLHEVYVKAVKIDPSLKQEQRNWNKTVRDTMINIGQIQPLEAVYNAQIQNLMNVLSKEETTSESDSETSAKVEEEQPKAVETLKTKEKQVVLEKSPNSNFVYICPKVVKITTIDGLSVEDRDIVKENTKIVIDKNKDKAKLLISGTMHPPVVVEMNIDADGFMSKTTKTGVELYAQHGKTYSGDKMVDDVRTLDYHHIYVDNRTGKEIEWKYSCVEKK